MDRHIYLLDLADVSLAEEYAARHRPGHVPKAVLADIRASGISLMEIHCFSDRLVMIVETEGGADLTERCISRASRAWEAQMEQLQRRLPGSTTSAKWQQPYKIFDLQDHPT